jgi:hypothetical protein
MRAQLGSVYLGLSSLLLSHALAAEARWRYVHDRLTQTNPASMTQVHMRVVPVEVTDSGAEARYSADRTVPRSADGALSMPTLKVGDYVCIDVMNTGEHRAFVSVLT